MEGRYPEFVDHSRLEHYMLEEDFEDVFGMDRATFEAAPSWKQEALKRELGLY